MATAAEQAAPWLKGRSFASWREEFDRQGYLIFERVLSPEQVAAIRAALAPHLARDLKGRNDFEGERTNRVYALMAKSPVFAELAIHPLALAFAEAELGESCLLSALLAINLHPGETVQPWHTDDGSARIPRPRPARGVPGARNLRLDAGDAWGRKGLCRFLRARISMKSGRSAILVAMVVSCGQHAFSSWTIARSCDGH